MPHLPAGCLLDWLPVVWVKEGAQAANAGGMLFLTIKHAGQRLLYRMPVAFQHGKTLEETIMKPARLEFEEVKLGHRIKSVLGRSSDWYHFFLIGKGGRRAVPYVLRGGKRLYLDMRNIALGKELDGLELEISVVSSRCDYSNSIAERIDEAFAASELLFHELGLAQRAVRDFVRRGARGELAAEPSVFLRMLAEQSTMSLRKLRDLYLRKLLAAETLPSFGESLFWLGAPGWWAGNSEDGADEGVHDFALRRAPHPPARAVQPASTMLLAGFQRLYYRAYLAEWQEKIERARIKSLGAKASAEEKERLASLEEDVRKRSLQLESLLVKNLEAARSAFICPSAEAS